MEDLLRRLQAEGYEIRRGKNLSCKVAEQKYFTHLKSLGIDYTEEAIMHRITGGLRPSKQPKKQDNRISLLIDIRNNLKAQESAGFAHWAKINNLKEAAKTMNYLTEHHIDSYEELQSRLDAATEQRDQLAASIKDLERQIAELAHIQKQAAIYRQYQPVYTQYQKARDKEKFLRGHESEIILFEAAARQLRNSQLAHLPDRKKLKENVTLLSKQLEQGKLEHINVCKKQKEIETIKRNVDLIFTSAVTISQKSYSLDGR